MLYLTHNPKKHTPWNKGKLIGQKAPLKLKEIWAIRIRLQLANHLRDLALFDLAIDSKLRACDLVKLRLRDIAHGSHIEKRAIIMQQKTQQPVQFEITEQTRNAVADWVKNVQLHSEDFWLKAGSTAHSTCRQDNMPESWNPGCPV